MKYRTPRAQRQRHEFGDVDGKISETRHRREDGFQRDDGDERDENLRLQQAARQRAQGLHARSVTIRGLIFGKGECPF